VHAELLLHGMLNAYWEPLTFELPATDGVDGQPWRRCIDTALASPDDIQPWDTALTVAGSTYTVQPRSVVFLAQALAAPPGSGDRAR
jgi:glycogen operon protein